MSVASEMPSGRGVETVCREVSGSNDKVSLIPGEDNAPISIWKPLYTQHISYATDLNMSESNYNF